MSSVPPYIEDLTEKRQALYHELDLVHQAWAEGFELEAKLEAEIAKVDAELSFWAKTS